MGKKDVLLVEDNPQDEMLILRIFRKIGLANEVVVVRDGQQAVDYLFRQGEFAARTGSADPTLVVLDIGLPRLSGLEALDRLRADPRTHLLPVVILTSSDAEQDRLRGCENGAISILHKPLGFAEFTEAVARISVYWRSINEPPFG